MSTNYANFAFWFYFDFQTTSSGESRREWAQRKENGEEWRSRSVQLAFWHCNSIEKIPDRHTSTHTHTHAHAMRFSIWDLSVSLICSSFVLGFYLLFWLSLFCYCSCSCFCFGFACFKLLLLQFQLLLLRLLNTAKKNMKLVREQMRKQLELELQLELKLDLALHLATANEASAESERFTSKFTRGLTTNLAATEPTGRTEPWRLSVLTFQTKLLRGPPWPAKVMSSRVKTQEHCRAARRGAPRLCSCRTSYRCHTNAPMGVRVRARAALPLAVCQFGGRLWHCQWLRPRYQLRQVAIGACSCATVSVRSHHCCRRPGTSCHPNVKPSCRCMLVYSQFALHHVVSCTARMLACAG